MSSYHTKIVKYAMRKRHTHQVNSQTKTKVLDIDLSILLLFLNLKYLVTEYYMMGSTGKGLEGLILGENPGARIGGNQVTFPNNVFGQSTKEFTKEIALNEQGHLTLYKNLLKDKTVDRPTIDLMGPFSIAAQKAKIVNPHEIFDPFSDPISFLMGGVFLGDTCVTTYNWAMGVVEDKKIRQLISGILSVESHHMGMSRALLYATGLKTIQKVNALSAVKNTLDRNLQVDRGIEHVGKTRFVPADENGVILTREPKDLLKILFMGEGETKGGFFPNGLRGNFKDLLN